MDRCQPRHRGGVERNRGQRAPVGEHGVDRFGLPRVEMRRDAGLELLDQHRHAFRAALAMADGKIDLHALARRPVGEEHLHGVADVALVCVVVLLRERRVLSDLHPGPQRIDPRIMGYSVLVIRRVESAEEQRNGDHVLNAVIAIGRIRERSRLVDDANRETQALEPEREHQPRRPRADHQDVASLVGCAGHQDPS